MILRSSWYNVCFVLFTDKKSEVAFRSLSGLSSAVSTSKGGSESPAVPGIAHEAIFPGNGGVYLLFFYCNMFYRKGLFLTGMRHI